MSTLTNLSTATTYLGGTVTRTATCMEAYVPNAAAAAPAATTSGVMYTADELTRWKSRISTGPFLTAGDYKAGSPGDWARIIQNRDAFVASGEPLTTKTMSSADRASHGIKARDAAFHYALTSNASSLSAVRKFLLNEAANSANDLSGYCFRDLSGVAPVDARVYDGMWLMRFIATYDYVRPALAASEKQTIEAFIRRNAYYLAAHAQWAISKVFPNRMKGDYTTRMNAAAATTPDTMWMTRRFDINNNCTIDSGDTGNLPVYAYVRADGTVGPRISVLSQYFNNRRSATVGAFGLAAALLGDTELANQAKRYFFEWLTYSVSADGSEGEYIRNGEYCLPKQGVIYAETNMHAATLVGVALARHNDRSLLDFSTNAGLFGTETPAGGKAKSLRLVITSHMELIQHKKNWYLYEGGKATQSPRTDTHLGRMDFRYMNGTRVSDSYHELGVMAAARYITDVPIPDFVLRENTGAGIAMPGVTGNRVDTGVGQWSDSLGVLSAALLTR